MSNKRAELVVALDFSSAEEALNLAKSILPVTPWMKVGLELFTAAGPTVVRKLKDLGAKVFLDLKFHDIPNTVAGAVRSAICCGADMCNVHIAGGEDMCRAAVKAAEEWRKAGQECILLGVTVLTSTAVKKYTAIQVLDYAVKGKAWGLDGVVCSGQEAFAIKEATGPSFIRLCPGIRPATYKKADDQSRVLTPLEAVDAGANYLVVGRPITQADDPVAAAQDIIASYSTQ